MRIRGAVLTSSEAAAPFGTSRPLEVVDLDLQDPGPGELLVQIRAAGVCHSDLSVVNGTRIRPLPMMAMRGHRSATSSTIWVERMTTTSSPMRASRL